MTAILGKFKKQSAEILDYDVDFTDWFADRSDTPASYTVTVEPGLTLVADGRTDMVVKIVLGGGTDGERYKTTVRLTSTTGLVKEADFYVTIKDI